METTEADKVDNVVKVDTKYIYKLLLEKYNDPGQYACAGEDLENSRKEFEMSVDKIEEMLGKMKEPVVIPKEASTSDSGTEKES